MTVMGLSEWELMTKLINLTHHYSYRQSYLLPIQPQQVRFSARKDETKFPIYYKNQILAPLSPKGFSQLKGHNIKCIDKLMRRKA